MFKLTIAVIIVVVSVVAAEQPAPLRQFQDSFPAQPAANSAPYQPRGWRPSGPSFNLPLKSQDQKLSRQYGPPEVAPSTDELITTEAPITTESNTEFARDTNSDSPTSGKLVDGKKNNEINNAQNPGQYFILPASRQFQNLVLVPQTASVVAVSTPQAAAKPQKIVVQPQSKSLQVQAIPAFAKIQQPEVIQFVPAVQAVQYASSSSILTPYSASYVQIYQ